MGLDDVVFENHTPVGLAVATDVLGEDHKVPISSIHGGNGLQREATRGSSKFMTGATMVTNIGRKRGRTDSIIEARQNTMMNKGLRYKGPRMVGAQHIDGGDEEVRRMWPRTPQAANPRAEWPEIMGSDWWPPPPQQRVYWCNQGP